MKEIARGTTTWAGLSTETKPAADADGNGGPEEFSFFLETDTMDMYYYHWVDVSHQWHKFGE